MYIHEDQSASYRLLGRELIKRGFSVDEAVKDDKLYVRVSRPNYSSWTFRASRIRYPFTSLKNKELSVNKERAYEYVESLGESVPFTKYVSHDDIISHQDSVELLQKHAPLIVKPSNATLSRGLTLNITTPGQLEVALSHARSVSNGSVLIQEQVTGEEVRFLVLGGKVRAALLRRSARVVGDGVSTVAELVVRENENRKQLVIPHLSYPQLTKEMIPEHAFTDTTILDEGQVLELNKATMIKNGCSVYDILDRIDQGYVRAVEKIANSLDLPFIGVDIFISDLKTPPTSHNYWFIEFNTSPVLKLCYACRDGKMVDIVPMLVDQIEEYLKQD